MKRLFAIALCVLLAFSTTACSPKKPGNIHVTPSPDTVPSSILFDASGKWPENRFTQGLPISSGTVGWVMLDTERSTCGIQVNSISKEQFQTYYSALQNAGFSVIEKVTGSEKGQKFVSIGTLLSNGSKTVSLAYANSVLMMTLVNSGIEGSKVGFLPSGNLTNVYVSAYSTYDDRDGIQVITELYVPEGEQPKPAFSVIHGIVTVTVGEITTTHYLGSAQKGVSAGIAVNTARLGASGEKGFVSIAGTACADNAPAGCGSFAISYEITIP